MPRIAFPPSGAVTAAGQADISARVTRSTAQSIANATETAISFDTVRWDTDGMWDAANATRLTCQTAGKYLIVGNVRFAGAAGGYRQAGIKINGTATYLAIDKSSSLDSATVDLNPVAVYDLAAGDFIELYVFQNSGGNLNVEVLANSSPELSMIKIV